jgi:hypothetical protein
MVTPMRRSLRWIFGTLTVLGLDARAPRRDLRARPVR